MSGLYVCSIPFYLPVTCVSALTKLNHPCSLSSASLALRVEPLDFFFFPSLLIRKTQKPSSLCFKKVGGFAACEGAKKGREDGDGRESSIRGTN